MNLLLLHITIAYIYGCTGRGAAKELGRYFLECQRESMFCCLVHPSVLKMEDVHCRGEPSVRQKCCC